MSSFRKIIDIEPGRRKIDHKAVLLLMGSCFAENINTLLVQGKFSVNCNPFGILYNPASVCRALRRLLEPVPYTKDDLIFNQGRWISLDHHGLFAAADPEISLRNMNTRLSAGAESLRTCRFLVLTLGTAFVYLYGREQRAAANCHRLPAADFTRSRLTDEAIAGEFEAVLRKIRKVNPGITVIFTVSPVRHWKDGAHGNSLSKAVLLLAVDRLLGLFDYTEYFPAYELLLDELRDYRFYAEDMLHPSPPAVEYIFQRFLDTYLSSDARAPMEAAVKIGRDLRHRSSDPEGPEYHAFLDGVESRIHHCLSDYPFLDFSAELNEILERKLHWQETEEK